MATYSDYNKPPATGYPSSAHSPAGTAYPYAAPPTFYPAQPPPAAPYYPPYYSSPDPISPARRLFRFIIIFGVIFFLCSGIISLIVWLVLKPQIPNFAVSSASVSNLNVSSSSSASLLSGDFNFSLDVANPNKKMSVDYSRLEAFLGYGGVVFSSVTLPPFSQGKESEDVVGAKLAPRDEYVSLESATEILKEKSEDDGVRFQIRVLAKVTFRAGGWRARRRIMRVYCDDVRIKFGNSTAVSSSSGSMVGSKSKCDVHL